MTTTTIQKTNVETTWTTKRIQEETASALTGHMLVVTKVLATAGPEAVKQVRGEWMRLRVEYFRAQGVKTPIDLVKAWTEYDTNMFGSKMRFWGNEQEAHVEYEYCGCWSALERLNTTEKEQELMTESWDELSSLIATEFGFVGKEKYGTEPGEAGCTITFTVA